VNVTRLSTTVIPVSPPWRRLDYWPKHVGKNIINKNTLSNYSALVGCLYILYI